MVASTRGRGSKGDGKLYMVFRHILKIESIGYAKLDVGVIKGMGRIKDDSQVPGTLWR